MSSVHARGAIPPLAYAVPLPITVAHMVLCAGNADHTKVEFVDVPAGAAIGERVFVEGESGDPVGAGNMKKKKVFAALAKDLKTSDACVAQWKGKAIMTSAGPCTVPSLGGVFIK